MNHIQHTTSLTIDTLEALVDQHITPQEKKALERAISWLKNITDPLPEADHTLWYENCAMNEAQAYHDDGDIETIADAISATSTDEDKRLELKEYQDETNV